MSTSQINPTHSKSDVGQGFYNGSDESLLDWATSLLNPYEPPEVSTEVSQPTARREAPLIWFAATVAALWCVRITLHHAYFNEHLDAITLLFVSLQKAGPVAIGAVVIYAAMRDVFRRRFDFASTRLSLVLAGIAVVMYLAVFHHYKWHRPWNQAWLVGALVGVPFGLSVAAAERLVTRIAPGRVGKSGSGEAESVRTQAAHASILWFAAAAFLLMFMLSPIMYEGELGLSIVYVFAESSAMGCLIFTAAYGLLSACFYRAHPATSVSRVTAAAVYLGAMCAMGYLLPRTQAVTAWLPPLMLGGPAFLAVPADRLVARLSAGTNDCNSTDDSSESVLIKSD